MEFMGESSKKNIETEKEIKRMYNFGHAKSRAEPLKCDMCAEFNGRTSPEIGY